VILDKKGEYLRRLHSAVEWDSNNDWKGDDSQKSFLFTLENPHNIQARTFALKAEKKKSAICCSFGTITIN
jgi:hypothetical protein